MHALHQPIQADVFQLTRFDHGIIRRKVNQLIGYHGLKEQDRESLMQELLVRLLHSLESFDPARSHRNAFVTTVVERSVRKIIRHHKAEKRDHRRISSLNVKVPMGHEKHVELESMIGIEEYDARRCQNTRSAEDQSDLSHDVANLLAQLPVELRQLAEQLKEKPLAQIAREMQIPRSRLRDRLDELREHFERADMRFHL